MDTLPRWASTSLATLCAQMIVPSLENYWPTLSDGDRRLLDNGLQAALESSERGIPSPDLDNYELQATRLAGSFELWLHATETENAEMLSVADLDLPRDTNPTQVKIAGTIIDVAARAIRIAKTRDRDTAFSECGDALEWARAVMDHLPAGDEIDQKLDLVIDSIWAFCEASKISDTQGLSKTNEGWMITGTGE